MTTQRKTPRQAPPCGIGHWMQRVLKEIENVGTSLAPDPVHDLRVAIRRCRAIGEAFRELDADSNWQKMRRAGKALFAPLGELRDVQVMFEWLDKIGPADDPATDALRNIFKKRESILKDAVLAALQQFDPARWQNLTDILVKRATQIPTGGLVFQYLALERWQTAHHLHLTALRNRSKVAFHKLRIGIKHFRYIVENFLPDRLNQWGDDLKDLQDALGDVHDLDVLWETALKSGVFHDPQERENWRSRIADERSTRLSRYREKMVGSKSLWGVWREGLPQGQDLDLAIMAKLQAWAAFRDPDVPHTERITTFALELYDALVSNRILSVNGDHSRRVLQSAAIMHDVGRATDSKQHHKESARLISKIDAPQNWGTEDLQMAALVARYHRGALPRPEHRRFQQLSVDHQDLTRKLAGIMRLADAFDANHDGAIRRLFVAKNSDMAVIYADGYDPNSAVSEKIAAARHLLETTCNVPIFIRPWSMQK